MKILSHSHGFKDFDGFIDNGIPDKIYRIEFSSGDLIRVTPEHKFNRNDEWVRADELKVGDDLAGDAGKIVRIDLLENENSESCYDALNVKDCNSYWTNGVESHNCSLIYLDEFAFVERAEQFYTSTYPVISAGKTTKVIITSTANGVGNPFHTIYEGAITGKNEYVATRVDWFDVPGRDEEWKRQTIANTSERQFNVEFGNSFEATGSTLISADTILRLSAGRPISDRNDWKIYEDPIEDHNYIMAIDVAKGRGLDYSTANIIDISVMPFKQVAVYRNNTKSPLLLGDIVVPVARHYNTAYIIVEVNNGGDVVANAIYHDHEYENMYVESQIRSDGIGLTMTKSTKRAGCSNLKDMLETGVLMIQDQETIREFSTFSVSGASWAATEGNHDDLVMGLVSFAFVIRSVLSEEGKDLKDLMFQDVIDNLEDELMPDMIIDDYSAPDSSALQAHEEAIKELDEWNL
jgi:hypothetical protein